MKVVRTDMSRYHSEEFLRIIMEMIVYISKYGAANLGIEKLFAQLQELYQQADKLQEVIRKSGHTEELEVIEKLLESFIRGFIAVVRGLQRHPNEAKRTAARELYIMLKQYMKLILQSTDAERIAAVHNLLQDLHGPYAARVALLGVGEWVTSIEETHEKYLSTEALRHKEYFEKPKRELQKVRARIMPVYQAIINTVDANLVADGLGGDVVVDPADLDTGSHEDGDPTPPYLYGNINYNFAVDWNESLKKYRHLLAQRDGIRNAHKKDEIKDEDNDNEEEEEEDVND